MRGGNYPTTNVWKANINMPSGAPPGAANNTWYASQTDTSDKMNYRSAYYLDKFLSLPYVKAQGDVARSLFKAYINDVVLKKPLGRFFPTPQKINTAILDKLPPIDVEQEENYTIWKDQIARSMWFLLSGLDADIIFNTLDTYPLKKFNLM